MKKVSALALTASMYLAAGSPALAISGSLCPTNQTDGQVMNFNPLCFLAPGNNVLSNIINIAFIIVVILALIFLIYGAIKWITSGGDKAGVEAARNMIVAAVVGLAIAFLSYFILQLVFSLFGINFNNGNFFGELNVFNP